MKSKVKEHFATSFSGGVMGPPGWSAYELAVANGFNGSVEEWLDSLEGPPGPAPVLGEDYFTEEDKAQIVQAVLATDAVTGMQEDIRKIKEELAYVPLDITGISKNVGSTYEIGTKIYSVTVNWTINKDPVSQTFDGAVVDPAERSATMDYAGGLTTNKTFTVIATDEKDVTDKETTSISFYNGVYYGVLTDGVEIDSAAVLGLNKRLQAGKGLIFTANAGSLQRIAYALPVRYGTPAFWSGGFEGGFSEVQFSEPFIFENASGYKEQYAVWLSDNTGLGSTTVEVK